jgi:hypothetical protein
MKYPTKIKGLSERRRLIPKGKIRLGIKVNRVFCLSRSAGS